MFANFLLGIFISGEDMNTVEIAGLVSHIPVERELSSGIRTLSWRIKVSREESGSDSIPCVINLEDSTKTLVAKIEQLEVGQAVRAIGALRSRYWQGPGGNSSRIEVEVTSIKKIGKLQLE